MAITTENTFLMKGTGTYAKTTDSSVVASKTYYTRSGSSPNYVYTPVASPQASDLSNYYELTVTYAKLVDIKEFPDLGSAPSTVDITTLSDHQKKYLNGLKDPGTLEFSANFDSSDYATIAAISGNTKFAIWFGTNASGNPDGSNGKFAFEGEITCWVKGGSVEAAVDMGIAIAVSTEILPA